jgi:hypothetical protein
MAKKGWHKESARHALAGMGLKTLRTKQKVRVSLRSGEHKILSIKNAKVLSKPRGVEGQYQWIELEMDIQGEVHISEAQSVGHSLGIDWGKDPIDLEEFRYGMQVELEHSVGDTSVIDLEQPYYKVDERHDLETVGKIALAHLRESPDYYRELRKMEAKF